MPCPALLMRFLFQWISLFLFSFALEWRPASPQKCIWQICGKIGHTCTESISQSVSPSLSLWNRDPLVNYSLRIPSSFHNALKLYEFVIISFQALVLPWVLVFLFLILLVKGLWFKLSHTTFWGHIFRPFRCIIIYRQRPWNEGRRFILFVLFFTCLEDLRKYSLLSPIPYI